MFDICKQICSPGEKIAIDKMIDSGPQLAGPMEYNVVLSKYHILCSLLRQPYLNASKSELNDIHMCACVYI